MQKLFLHVGLAKTGTTFLQAVLAENRPRLREAGFIYPFVRREGMFQAAVEVRGDNDRWGLDPELVDGTWQALLDKAAGFDGTALISHEILAGASESQIAKAAEGLTGFDLHLVVTARDLARQVPAHWQEAVKNGQTFSFAEYTREVLREPGAPDSQFWNEQDLVGVLDRWAPLVAPEKVHLVICPPREAPRDELWHRFAEATGVPANVLELDVARANESLGAAAVHLLRAVNERVDLPPRSRALVVKRLFAQKILSEVPSAKVQAPQSLRPPLVALAEEWAAAIEPRGYTLHGSLDELRPREFGDSNPDDPAPLEGMPDVIAALLHEIAALREQPPRESV
jgi:hypothetical protein